MEELVKLHKLAISFIDLREKKRKYIYDLKEKVKIEQAKPYTESFLFMGERAMKEKVFEARREVVKYSDLYKLTVKKIVNKMT